MLHATVENCVNSHALAAASISLPPPTRSSSGQCQKNGYWRRFKPPRPSVRFCLASRPPHELPRLSRDLDRFAFLNKERNPDFDSSLQLCRLGYGPATRIAANAGSGVRHVQLHVGWQFQPDGVAVVLMQLDDGSFHY